MQPQSKIGRPFEITEDDFGHRLHTVISPSEAIQSAELLRGRAEQLAEIKRAFYSPGRQVFIFGHRGVGKTSLAQTAAFAKQSSDAKPIMVSCSAQSTCFEIVQSIATYAVPNDPREIKRTFATGGKLSGGGFGIDMRSKLETGSVPLPRSLAECARLLEFVSATHSRDPVVVIDEFDLIKSQQEQHSFANLVKMIGDQRIKVNLIFCGIGASLDKLFAAHMSAHRYFHTVELERLKYDPRYEIIDGAADALGIALDSSSRFRIAAISDGFPHYVHLLCEKLFWNVFYEDNGMKVTPPLFEKALVQAVESMKPELKKAYEQATRKYTNDYEQILWAVADGDELQRSSRDIYESYDRIMSDLDKDPLPRDKFNAKMNNLKKPSYARMLVATRAGWYEIN
jgi:uncharacterized protein